MFSFSFLLSIGKLIEATNVLVTILGGRYSRWKQNITYFMTPDGFNGADLKPIVTDIIQKAESIGLKVHCLASDKGPVNQALWQSFHACSAGRYSEILNSTVHLCDD